eukprot:1273877-Pyramimonas_sp.AAC.1
MRHADCNTYAASHNLHHMDCTSRGASQILHYVYCTTGIALHAFLSVERNQIDPPNTGSGADDALVRPA